ncbi:MAG: leucine-rich repeat domain-containing protein [Proteobacteria bacterium]|nr:leucine-rich repeat domain-containing protein [Pseudomonadota bacterium]
MKLILTKTLVILALLINLIFSSDGDNLDTNGDYRREVQNPVREHQEEVQRSIERVSYQDFLKMDDQQIQNVREVIVLLEQSYFEFNNPSARIFNQALQKNPNITVVLDCGDAKTIGDNCLKSITKMCKLKILAPNVREIGSYFLYECSGLTALDLSPLSNVTNIRSHFLSYCSGLTALDLSPLSNVRSIGESFLYQCTGLTALDLSPLSNVREIGHYFLFGCSGLTALNLTPLSNVREIGSYFLFGCSGLTALDLSPLSNVTNIGSFFLYECTGLTALDLTPLSNVTNIGSHFLFKCTGLTALDLNPLSNVRSIGESFLYQCTGLTALDLSPLSNVTSIGESFLSYCSGLTQRTVTVPTNWRLVNRLPDHLRPEGQVTEAQGIQTRQGHQNAVDQRIQNLKDDLKSKGIDPMRPGSDYTSREFESAGALLQGAYQSKYGYLRRLKQVFSNDRTFKILEDFTNGEDHSTDRDDVVIDPQDNSTDSDA